MNNDDLPLTPTQQAVQAISKVLDTADEETAAGLRAALALIGQALPDVAQTLSMAMTSLENASSMLHPGVGEAYAYEQELTEIRQALQRLEDHAYDVPSTTASPSL